MTYKNIQVRMMSLLNIGNVSIEIMLQEANREHTDVLEALSGSLGLLLNKQDNKVAEKLQDYCNQHVKDII